MGGLHFSFFIGKVSSLGWPQTLHIAEVDLELLISCLYVLSAVQVSTTMYAMLVTETKVSGTLDNTLLAGLHPEFVPTLKRKLKPCAQKAPRNTASVTTWRYSGVGKAPRQ